MDSKLQNKLFKAYPKLFRQRKLPMTQTCMCWGIDCGDGWFKWIERLCRRLQWDIDKNDYPQIEFTQIKEKFGSGRFYYCGAEGEYARLVESGKISQEQWDSKCGAQEAIISIFEDLVGETCEVCGKMDGVKQTEGWIVTLCPEHMKARK